MNPNVGIIFVVTKDFDIQKKFFSDLGLEVKSGDFGQVTPQLNRGRGCLIALPSLLISLEESTDLPPSGPLYLQIEGLNEGRLLSLRGRYSVQRVQGGLYGSDFYAIKVPGGGLIHAVTGDETS